ncbi:hypothetical protein Tco_0491685 [Tanacetum coccineum]
MQPFQVRSTTHAKGYAQRKVWILKNHFCSVVLGQQLGFSLPHADTSLFQSIQMDVGEKAFLNGPLIRKEGYGCSTRRDSGFELTAFSDADHAGCLDTRKSTSGGIQFLGDKLVSWMLKKQNCTAMSSAGGRVRGSYLKFVQK